MIEARVEKNVSIERGADFDSRLSIGGNSSRGINAEAHEPVTLGCNVMMCPECATLTRNHAHARTDIPMIEQGFEEHRTVEVDNGVWIGRRVIILLGVTIGDGAIVSAGAVVTKDVEPYTIVGGAPARPIEHR